MKPAMAVPWLENRISGPIGTPRETGLQCEKADYSVRGQIRARESRSERESVESFARVGKREAGVDDLLVFESRERVADGTRR